LPVFITQITNIVTKCGTVVFTEKKCVLKSNEAQFKQWLPDTILVALGGVVTQRTKAFVSLLQENFIDMEYFILTDNDLGGLSLAKQVNALCGAIHLMSAVTLKIFQATLLSLSRESYRG
jgi:DNA topoisomerase VI subunit A